MYWTKDDIERIFNKVIELFVIPRFEELGMEATGEWRENLHVESGMNSVSIMGRQYTEQLTNGLEPGHLVPIPALQEWAKAKFGLNDQAALSAAFAVREKIKQKGTTWYEQGGSNLIEVLQEPRTLQYINDELGAIAQVRIADEIKRTVESIF